MNVKVACCQLALDIDNQKQNQERIEWALREAHAEGSSIVVLPELVNTGYMFADVAELQHLAEPRDGPTISRWEELARELDLIIVGGFAEAGHDGSMYNSAALIDNTGVRAVYRKTHLWNSEKVNLFVPGDMPPPVIETPVGRIGMLICYDVEFPELMRYVALQKADLLCAPVNWPLYPRPIGERPTEVVKIQAEASRNRMAIACADRVGRERGQAWLGASAIIDANGYLVTSAQIGHEEVIQFTVDLSDSRNKYLSERNHVHNDRLPQFYEKLRRQEEV